MPAETLPTFRYHPDPVATGSIKPSDNVCVCCKRSRGYIYTGPVYAEDEHDEDICPWCIANGSAYEQLDAEFADPEGVGDYGNWCRVPEEVTDEIVQRTPGFNGWQQERWFTCCEDGAAFLGRAGHAELVQFGEQAIEAIRLETGWDAARWDEFFVPFTGTGIKRPTPFGACTAEGTEATAILRETLPALYSRPWRNPAGRPERP